MKRCLIIAGGDYAPIRPGRGDFILACDRGYAWCKQEGIVPDLILGDFDSYTGALPEADPGAALSGGEGRHGHDARRALCKRAGL